MMFFIISAGSIGKMAGIQAIVIITATEGSSTQLLSSPCFMQSDMGQLAVEASLRIKAVANQGRKTPLKAFGFLLEKCLQGRLDASSALVAEPLLQLCSERASFWCFTTILFHFPALSLNYSLEAASEGSEAASCWLYFLIVFLFLGILCLTKRHFGRSFRA